jgi:hypothetical protein
MILAAPFRLMLGAASGKPSKFSPRNDSRSFFVNSSKASIVATSSSPPGVRMTVGCQERLPAAEGRALGGKSGGQVLSLLEIRERDAGLID